MSGIILLLLGALELTSFHNQLYDSNDSYIALPRFWTNTGFCPTGGFHHKEITQTLLSDTVQMNMRYIAALPNGAITHVRIHWLLELLNFVQYTQNGIPIYDFTDLDVFILNLDDLGLYPVVEFMGNPGNVFTQNPSQNRFLWEDFSYQIVRHYLNILGAKKLLQWRFETWNEPDLISYNKLNFTIEDYIVYVNAIRDGLADAGRRAVNILHFPLRGPAGLFKLPSKHPICWKILEYCNQNMKQCPFETLTYHRKGNGTGSDIVKDSNILWQKVYKMYPLLTSLPISNDEADPMSGWSKPQTFYEDVRYAAILVNIVMDHWNAKLTQSVFKNFESISNDNAFLSYYPYEFSQRTMLAHFRMNNTKPIYSQFIQKPVYSALGLLAKLGPFATDIEILETLTDEKVRLLKTTAADDTPLFLSWLLVSSEKSNMKKLNHTLQLKLPIQLRKDETFAFVIELLEQQRTDPAYVWHSFGKPPYPNATIRELMRRKQTPTIHATGILQDSKLEINIGDVQLPWIMLLRLCSNSMQLLKQPQQLVVMGITKSEVLLTWTEVSNTTQCLKNYEVWFLKATRETETNALNWSCITDDWQLPFPSFTFAPSGGTVNGFYKVRGIDVFQRTSEFSKTVEYIEI